MNVIVYIKVHELTALHIFDFDMVILKCFITTLLCTNSPLVQFVTKRFALRNRRPVVGCGSGLNTTAEESRITIGLSVKF